ncbi:MAG: carbohydrate binding family 9 domain-containing protein, partial [Candidatus Aminicenantes bacterium]|nr:carbohydrate binding family 9 domain-containing protein [Candidatus Aminicenantes bacterium]
MRHHNLLVILCLILVSPLSAGGPTQKAVRAEAPPVVDGRLDETIWRESEPFSGFLQVFPTSGAAPSERTELRVAFDGSFLYLAVRCDDSDPARISANSMAHDVSDFFRGASDDVVKVILDPFQDMRNAYLFTINARGGRSEGLASGERASLNWDGIWEAKARIDERGWSCEMAIPFKTLSFKPGLSTWGINVERYIPRKQETIRLAGIRQDAFFTNPAEAAPLEGILDIAQGLGLTIRPYGAFVGYRDHAGAETTDWSLDGGIDLFKNFTPNFVGAVSVNTDFAETEVDDRRINLTRFDMFFPEKRAFFLQGSEYFSFGSPSGFRDIGFLPFFSRTIGICEEEVIPVALGAKVYGKLGGTNIAFLDVLTRDVEGIPGRNFLAARISQNVLAESKIGLIFTQGCPDGTSNSLAGLDWTFQTSQFLGDRNFVLAGWAVYNWNELSEGKKYGYGFKVDYPNDLLDMAATYSYYGDALSPGLGY